MGVFIKRDNPNGKMRPTWHGRVTYKGQAHEENLKVPIAGTVPRDENGRITTKRRGDEAFERSRKAAQKALEALRKAIRTNPAELQESAYKAHTGVSMAGVPLPKLIDKWMGVKRQRKPTAERTRIARLTFKRFGDFARKFAQRNGKRCDTLNDVTADIAAAWFEAIRVEYAWGTVKDMMHLMSGAFRRWATNGQHNPFSDVILNDSQAQGEEKKRTERKALTPEQFKLLLEYSRENERLYPLVVCAAFTGMRIGDVCRLKVADVDLQNNTIDCVTAKAGVRVNIPILTPEFHEILSDRCAIPADGSEISPYVFPWAAAQYERNNTAIKRSIKPYIARAVFGNEQPIEEAKLNGEPPPDIAAVVANAGFCEAKQKRVVEVYNRFKAGEPSTAIAAAMHIARGQVSAYLKDAEHLTGENLRPRASKNGKRGVVDLLELTRVKRTVGKHSASIWGWHNLRHTFITYALNQGVPLHKVQTITGQKTKAVTLSYADMETDTETKKNAAIVPVLTSKGNSCPALPTPVHTEKTPKDRLRELKDLLDDGFITSAEYEERRKAIINGI